MPTSHRVSASFSRLPSQPPRSQTLSVARCAVRFSPCVSVMAEIDASLGTDPVCIEADAISYTPRRVNNGGRGWEASDRAAELPVECWIRPVLECDRYDFPCPCQKSCWHMRCS